MYTIYNPTRVETFSPFYRGEAQAKRTDRTDSKSKGYGFPGPGWPGFHHIFLFFYASSCFVRLQFKNSGQFKIFETSTMETCEMFLLVILNTEAPTA